MDNPNFRVLVIDDKPDNVFTFKVLIKEAFENAVFFSSDNGKDGISMSLDENPDVILLDILMPEMDGFETCRRLKEDQRTSEIPVIFITALRDEKDIRIKALEAGGDAFLLKPVDKSELIAQIRVMLKVKEANTHKKNETKRLENLVNQRTRELINELEGHQKTEKALIQSQKSYEAIFNSVSEAIYIQNAEGKFINVNKGALQMYGFTLDEMIGKVPNDLAAPGMNDMDKVNQLCSQVLRTGTSATFEFFGKRKNGEIFPKEVIANRGNYFGEEVVIATARDISERKLAEQKIHQANVNWNHTFDSIHDGIAILNNDQKIIQTNQAFRKFLEHTTFHHCEESCFHYIHHTACPVPGCPFVRMKESKVREKMEMELGENIFEIVVDPIINDSGDIDGAVHILSDITLRKREEIIRKIQYNIAHYVSIAENLNELLGVVQKELSLIMDTSNFFVAFYNPESDLLYSSFWADENDDFTEWPAEGSLTGKVVKENKSLLLKREDIKQLIQNQGMPIPGTMAECWLGVPLKTPHEIIGAYVVQSYTNPDAYDTEKQYVLEIIANQLSIYIAKKRKEQELILAKEKAEESDRLKTAFLANMSHEIRTPMNGILGFVDLLQNPTISEERQHLYLQVIKESSNRLLNTINDIIEISRIEADQSPLSFSSFNLNETLLFLYSFFEPEARNKGLYFNINNQLNDNELQISSDKNKLVSVLSNLIKNAIKFTSKGDVEFGCKRQDDKLLFYVKDTGVGIPADKFESVFDRFVQADLDLSRPYEGSGLGLSIARAYVNMMGGRIWLESALDIGSTFYFTINFIVGSVVTDTKQKDEIINEVKPLKQRTILIAEDDNAGYTYLEVLLSLHNYQCIRAKNGFEAVSLFQARPDIFLILMDLKMPGMDGYQATKIIRQHNAEIPIIAQTAFALSGDREKAIEAGCTDYISKPIKKEELFILLKKYGKIFF